MAIEIRNKNVHDSDGDYIARRCTELGCSPGVLKYIEKMEQRVGALEERFLQFVDASQSEDS